MRSGPNVFGGIHLLKCSERVFRASVQRVFLCLFCRKKNAQNAHFHVFTLKTSTFRLSGKAIEQSSLDRCN